MGKQKYTSEFRESAVRLVTDQKQTVPAATDVSASDPSHQRRTRVAAP